MAEEKENATRSLVQKISEAVKKTKPVSKDGHNNFSKYSYVTDQQVSSVMHALSDEGVIIVPNITVKDKWDVGKNHFVEVDGEFLVTDGNEQMVGHMPGVGADTLDKAVYKAATGAKKNFAMQLLMLSTDTDTDDDKGKGLDQKNSNNKTHPAPKAEPVDGNQIKTLQGLVQTISALTNTNAELVVSSYCSAAKVKTFGDLTSNQANQLITLMQNKIKEESEAVANA